MVTEGLRLPAEVAVAGETLVLRRMDAGDGGAMIAFARALPEHDLLFLRRDITRDDDVDAWIADNEAGSASTVLALRGDAIVGYATVAGSGLSWTSHVAELRVLVGESMRRAGLGRVLVNEAFHVAVESGVEKMIAQMTPDQEGAIGVFYRMGFEEEARLRGHVRDRAGQKHDLIVLSQDVSAYQAARREHER